MLLQSLCVDHSICILTYCDKDKKKKRKAKSIQLIQQLHQQSVEPEQTLYLNYSKSDAAFEPYNIWL